MSLSITTIDSRGSHTWSEADFPLIIGAGRNAHFLVPHAEAAVVANLGTQDGHVFLQALPGCHILYNGTPVTGSVWLENGAVIDVEGKKILCEAAPEQFRLQLDHVVTGAPDPIPATTFRPPSVEPAKKKSGGKGLLIFLLLAFLGLAAVAGWFVLSSESVSVTADPDPDRFELSGGLFRIPVGDRYLVRPGVYKISASKKGYHDLSETIVVSKEAAEFSFAFKKLPGKIVVRARADRADNRARLEIDGKLVGQTEWQGELEPGTYQLVASAENYVTATNELTVVGMGNEQAVDFELVPNWAEIRVKSVPSGAEVWVESEQVDPTPSWFELSPETYAITVKKAGYQDWKTNLVVKANVPVELSGIVLALAEGTLVLETIPPGANVSVDGTFRGQSPLTTKLTPGVAHQILVSKAGYDLQTQEVQVESGKETRLSLLLVERLGKVRFAATPSDAELFLDGVSRGAASQVLSLRTAPVEVEFRKTGFASFKRTITPRVGFELEVATTLKALAPVTPPPSTTPAKPAAVSGMVLIQPETFEMGSPRNEQGRISNETRRRVYMTRPFLMAATEVSNKEFRVFDPGHDAGRAAGTSINDDLQPAANITWDQAAAYCNWLSEKEKLPPAYVKDGSKLKAANPIPAGSYRLPTEAEWEYVARRKDGVSLLKYPWGMSMPPSANAGNFGTIAGYKDVFGVSAPVGQYPANELGIRDLGGNVSEWCHDFYGIYSVADRIVLRDPAGPDTGRHRVVRGASWKSDDISTLRLAWRGYSKEKAEDVGFRVCRYPPASE